MGVAHVASVTLAGIDGAMVDVEADIANGLYRFTIIGLPDASIAEAKERVRSAVSNSGIEFPNARVTVNLSPGSIPKHGVGFDLPIAMAILVARGIVDRAACHGIALLGELTLDGRLRPVRGVLPAVVAAKVAGFRRVMVPTANVTEASCVSGIDIVGASGIRDAAITLGARLKPTPVDPILGDPDTGTVVDDGDLSDVVGQPDAVEAMIIAAAGRHHSLMVGPPGSGKTTIATRIAGILPDLSESESLQVTSLQSLVNPTGVRSLQRRPPWQAPHHSATAPAIVGGGSGIISPGAASLASHGILFLDEAPEFARNVLDSLRQSLESGVIEIHRAKLHARFPAQFLLVLAANPCPCGQDGVIGATCSCTPMVKRSYFSRISGPLLDRVDLQVRVPKVTTAELHAARPAFSSTDARSLVGAARASSAERLRSTPWTVNAQVSGSYLRGRLRLPRSVVAPLDRAFDRGALTMRGYDRVLRVSWTVSDLAGHDSPTTEDLGRALFYRKGES